MTYNDNSFTEYVQQDHLLELYFRGVMHEETDDATFLTRNPQKYPLVILYANQSSLELFLKQYLNYKVIAAEENYAILMTS
jgi:hypothetical protein